MNVIRQRCLNAVFILFIVSTLSALHASTTHAAIFAMLDDQSGIASLQFVRAHDTDQQLTLLGATTGKSYTYLPTAPHCPTIGSEELPRARKRGDSPETIPSRINMINLWLGNLCSGKSDILPGDKEAMKWLLELQDIKGPLNEDELYPVHELLLQTYLNGAPGFKPDYRSLIKLFDKAREDHRVDNALYEAFLYQEGLGVEKNPKKVRDTLEQIATKNDDARLLIVQDKELGNFDYKNEEQAFSEYLSLAQAEQQVAQFKVAMMFLEGRGRQKNVCTAKYWVQQIAKSDTHIQVPASLVRQAQEKIAKDGGCPQPIHERNMIALSRGYGGNSDAASTAKSLIDMSNAGTRSPAEIMQVLEANKGSIYSLYFRALRNNPDLKGKVTFELTISAYGEVVQCKAIYSDLGDSELESKIIARIKYIRFPAADVKPIVVRFPIEFDPFR